MPLEQWLSESTSRLSDCGISSARLDCLILLEDELVKDRSWLLAHLEEKITAAQLKKLNKKLNRRATHEPLAYIRGFSEFYGRVFIVNKHVLQPRPESEIMIELLKNLPLPKNAVIVDVGTGSGALAVTAKLELIGDVLAIDIDPACLKIARANAAMLGAEIKFLPGDLLKPLKDQSPKDLVILANLPYVPINFGVNEAASKEPALAIFGGNDGLDIYRQLFQQLSELASPAIFVLVESLPIQHSKVAKLASKSGYGLYKQEDFIQVFRPN